MIKNYVIIALRSFRRNKLYASLNILGLSVGIACFMLLYLYIQHESSYDQFHSKSKQLYQTVLRVKIDGKEWEQYSSSAALAPAIKKEYPEVQAITRFQKASSLLQYQATKLRVEDLAYVDKDFINLFDFSFVQGNRQQALAKPNALVLTENLALKLFGTTTNVLNKVVETGDGTKLTIQGILKNIPSNSSIRFSGLISFNTHNLTDKNFTTWHRHFLNNYVLLRPGTNHQALNKKLLGLEQKLTKAGFFNDRYTKHAKLQPLGEVYLKGLPKENEGVLQYIYIFGAIAGFILLIACINYMNMATSGALNRAKEVGIRKVVGSHQKQLIGQFLIEAVVMVVIALLIGLALVELALPYFSKLAGKDLVYSLLDPSMLGLILGLTIIVGVLSGAYPAFFMSAFNASLVLKGKFIRNTKTARLRKGLVVFQFALSAIILVSTWISFQQFSFMMNTSLGYDKSQIYIVPLAHQKTKKGQAKILKTAFLQHPSITGVTLTSSVPGRQTWESNVMELGRKGEKNSVTADVFITDEVFAEFMGLKLLKGEPLTKKDAGDSVKSAWVNETFMREAGWKLNADDLVLNPIGQRINRGSVKIIGVFKDVHIRSLHHKIRPMMIVQSTTVQPRYLYAKLATNNLNQAIQRIQKTYGNIEKQYPFQGFFLDQNFAKEYQADQKRVKIFSLFSLLTVLIACLGLFGLASFTIAQRTKEIGIRKVLGASLQNILQLITKDFIVLVLLANIIAAPAVIYLTKGWLGDFAYQVSINYLLVFALAAVAGVGIALLTISWHVVRATRVNPVEVLKDE